MAQLPLQELGALRHAQRVAVVLQGAPLAGPGDGGGLPGVFQVVGDQRGALLLAAVGDHFGPHLEELVQVLLVVGDEEGAAPGRLEEPHVVGEALGHVDVPVHRDPGGGEHPEHRLPPDLAVVAGEDGGVGGERVGAVAPELDWRGARQVVHQLVPLAVHGGEPSHEAAGHGALLEGEPGQRIQHPVLEGERLVIGGDPRLPEALHEVREGGDDQVEPLEVGAGR